MDTSKYDNKMEELRNEERVKNSVGRPKGEEKVYFRKYVLKAQLASIEEWFSRTYGLSKGWAEKVKEPNPEPAKAPEPRTGSSFRSLEVDELKEQIKALLEDNERLSKEVATVEHRLQRVARLTDNEKLILWIRKYDELKKVYDLRVGGSEFSQ